MLCLALSPEDSMSTSAVTFRDHRINWIQSIPFFAFHLFAGVAVFFVPFHWSYVVWALALYLRADVGVTAGYHRYFSHRAFKTSRVFQFVLAFLGRDLRAEGRAVVGGAPPAPPPGVGPAGRTCTRRCRTASGGATSGWILCDKYDETR